MLIFAAMSGGVDSAVTAWLLRETGHQVVGVTMDLWPKAAEGGRECCSLAAAEDARRVAALLGIPHYTWNLREVFQEEVVRPFQEGYLAGVTPNPCLWCNAQVKFKHLWRRVAAAGGEGLATGHYVRSSRNPAGFWGLKVARDLGKDQSYALYNLTQEDLSHLLFPLGDRLKTDVRRLARELGLPVADKPDSQDICFVPRDYRQYLREEVGDRLVPGPILDRDGQRVGTHSGIALYTIGQRKGLGLAAGRPLYVVAIRVEENAIVVGDEADLFRREVDLEGVSFVQGPSAKALAVQVKIRYKAHAEPAFLELRGEGARLVFRRPVRAVTPGQVAVFYLGDEMLGGGIIR